MSDFELLNHKLDKIIETQNDHTAMLNDHSATLNDHTAILKDHSASLKILLDYIGHTPDNKLSLLRMAKSKRGVKSL